MKKTLSLCMMILSYMAAHAQATDLVIDNQTPGWLSSKINYSDQQTVENLKVTGYISKTDLYFIGSLIKNRNLKGCIDLSDSNIVGEDDYFKDDFLGSYGKINCFGLDWNEECAISTFCYPKSLKDADRPLNHMQVDTVFYDCATKYITADYISDDCTINNMYVGENIDSIPERAFADLSSCIINNVHLSTNVFYVGKEAFEYNTRSANINELQNLTTLGKNAFRLVYVDTLFVPKKLSTFNTSCVHYNDYAHIFVPSSVETIDNSYYLYRTIARITEKSKVTFHMENANPPVFIPGESNALKNCIVRVPRGSYAAYKNAEYWKLATIIEDNPIQTINLNSHEVLLDIDETISLVASPYPLDADDISIIWKSGNESILSVNDQGIIKGISSGEAMVYAISKANPEISDSCRVTVIKHVESINLSFNQIELNGLGQTKQITPIVLPEDATDKSVRWSSSNESVCFVTDNGTAIAMGEGTAVVLALTNDGNLPATCVVTVSLKKEATDINDVRHDCDDSSLIFSHDGKLLGNGVSTLRHLTSGIYIIKKGNEFVKVKL